MSERHVIKVPAQPQADMMGGGMPPTAPPPPMPDMGGEDMGMGPDPVGDEGESKEDLQSMAGKMSNIIQNGTNIDKDDVKAALNMIIAQAKKVLDGNDLKASADKLTTVSDVSSEGGPEGQEQPAQEPMQGPEQAPQMESRRYLKNTVNEILNDLNGNADAKDKYRDNKDMTNKTISRGNPFVSSRQ